MPFHVTARLQGRAAWLRGIERAVVSRILDAPRRSDADLLAYAVMPNHLHVMLLQGRQPLSEFMQPLLRRIALLVQRRTSSEGHIFERRFRASACLDPDYFRNAVAYVHLNGVRAKLSTTVDEYAWCSHAAYCTLPEMLDARVSVRSMESVLRLFAVHERDTLTDCRANYCSFLEWRQAADAHRLMEADGWLPGPPPERPMTTGGDLHWRRNYSSANARTEPGAHEGRPDLLDLARRTLEELAPDMDMELLRSGGRSRALVAIRHRLILRALDAGHAGGIIARFLHIAPTTVSSVRTAAMYDGR